MLDIFLEMTIKNSEAEFVQALLNNFLKSHFDLLVDN